MDIDVKTLFFLFAAGNFFIVFFFSLYILLYKNIKPIIHIYMIAKAFISTQWLLLALRNNIPDFYTIVLANVLYIFGYFYEIYCIAIANQEIESKRLLLPLFFPVLTSVLFLSFLSSPENTRIIVASLIITVYYMGGGIFLVIAKSKTKIQRLIGSFYLAVSLLFLSRALWASFEGSAVLYTNNNFQIFSYMFFFLVSFSGAIALLLILKEKDEERITHDNLKLRELNINKDKFFSIIAHDLKGPLRNLSQLGELLLIQQDEKNKQEEQIIINHIIQSAKGTFNLLDNLLKWANSSSGRMVYNPQMISVNKMVEEYFLIFKGKAESKKIALQNDLPPNLEVFADYDMFHTLIRNLISNAVKFTPESGKISIKSQVINDRMVSIGVTDTGVGIAQDDLIHLFDIDSKHTTLGTNREKGSGLGLKLCKEFVEKNKGEIWVKSEINVGTEFWFSVPNTKI